MADQPDTGANQGIVQDVQRGLAWLIVGVFAIVIVTFAIRIAIWGAPDDVLDLLKTVISALINVVMLVLGYFYGSSKAKETTDASQQRMVDKLTSAAPGTLPPPPPLPPSTPTPWWTKLTDAEKNAITAAALNTGGSPDPRVQAFVTASQVGAANADDLDYLVAKGLLTQDRANEIKAA